MGGVVKGGGGWVSESIMGAWPRLDCDGSRRLGVLFPELFILRALTALPLLQS